MWKVTPDGIVIAVKVIPKASHNAILGWENGELKIRVAAQPEKGGANEELLAFLAKKFGISKSRVKLISGASSRHKRICLIDATPALLSPFDIFSNNFSGS